MRILLLGLVMCQLASVATAQKNVLLIIGDDIGLDNVSAYGENPDAASTPNIDGLADRGVLFRRAYSNPVCSPTRATILTGRYAWRTGMGAALVGQTSGSLILSTPTIADVMNTVGYGTAAVGKWHMANFDFLHPLAAGFDQCSGSPGNINNYFNYAKNVNGVVTDSPIYATTDTVNDTLSLMTQMQGAPWFLWVAFNSAHTPFHKPSPGLHGYTLPAQIAGNEPIHTKAMIEAMDTEIGRLLDAVNFEETLVIFVGDNGPDSLSVTPPWDPSHAKHTVYDLGIHVALIIAGAGTVEGLESNALVNTTDLYATIAEVANAPTEAAVDSVSLWRYLIQPGAPSLRSFVYSERFVPNFDPATGWPGTFQIRMQSAIEERYKLNFEYLTGSTQVDPDKRELFDLVADPFETVNLLKEPLTPEAAAAYAALRANLVGQGPSPWTGLGQSLPGTAGPPQLEGTGSLVPESVANLHIVNGLPGAAGTLYIGFSPGNEPFHCGILVPTPNMLIPFTLDEKGANSSSFVVPQLPGNSPLFMQAWIADPGGVCEYAATNGLMGSTAP